MTLADDAPTWSPLNARERRVLGVLVEKAKTTPEYYPMTVAAIVTACNQKSNRDPVVNYDTDDVEEVLQGLRKKGATILYEGGGRVVRWRHALNDWLKVTKAELAVLTELMLRGPQTEGDLRARVSRMEPLHDLPMLHALLEALAPRGLVTHLTPPGVKRGAVVAHGLYPPQEAEKVRQAFANLPAAAEEDEVERPVRQAAARHVPDPGLVAETRALREEVDALKLKFEALSDELRSLKSALGA